MVSHGDFPKLNIFHNPINNLKSVLELQHNTNQPCRLILNDKEHLKECVGAYNVAKFGEVTLGLEMGMKSGLFGMLQIALPRSLTKHFNLTLDAKRLQTTSYT
jgi:hypothetical protein